jgi:hypothetical protein
VFSRPLAPTSSTSSVPCTISSSSLLPPCRAAPLQAASLPDRWYAGAEIRISEGGSWLAALKLMRGWLLASLAGVLGAPPPPLSLTPTRRRWRRRMAWVAIGLLPRRFSRASAHAPPKRGEPDAPPRLPRRANPWRVAASLAGNERGRVGGWWTCSLRVPDDGLTGRLGFLP